jgi:hypothetical protein
MLMVGGLGWLRGVRVRLDRQITGLGIGLVFAVTMGLARRMAHVALLS